MKRTGTVNQNTQLAERLGILAPLDTTTEFIPGTWSDVLADHARRCEEAP